MARRLCEQVEQLQPLITRKRGSNPGELGIEAVLEGAVTHEALCIPDITQPYDLSRNVLTNYSAPCNMGATQM